MGYKKGPVGHMKAPAGNKAVGYMAEGSAAYMSALYQTDSRDGDGDSRIASAMESLKKKREADASAAAKAKKDAAAQKKLAQLRRESDNREADRVEKEKQVENVVDSLNTVREQGELAAAKKYGNFTRAVSKGGVEGQSGARSSGSTDVGTIETNKAVFGRGLSTDANNLEPTDRTDFYIREQKKRATENPNVFPSGYDRSRGTYQGYKK